MKNARALGLLLATLAVPATADEPAATHVVAAGPQYKGGLLRKTLLGAHYRKLWATPIRVPVLDLAGFHGGLTPDEKGGGKQTRSLKFKSADGREWKVRSVDKDPTNTLPPGLEHTVVDALVQDQISAAHPAGPDIVDVLADAAGLHHVHRTLVVIPDDARLGEFRKEFAGMLGYLEEDLRVKDPATPGFEGFAHKKDTVELWEHLDAHPGEKVDARALLRARLFDVFIGDFDRHKDNWEWVAKEGSGIWEPVPQDRDQAFVKFDGFVLAVGRPFFPRLVDFERDYPDMHGLVWQGRFIDRRHLTELEWPAWEEVARDLQGRLTDRAIDEAVHAEPAEYFALDGPRMISKLRGRRDDLLEAAREFYRIVSEDAEVWGSGGADHVDIRREGRDTIVELRTAEGAEPWFARRFHDGETDEVRVYLGGGDDVVRATGDANDLKVRVVGGPGDDTYDVARGVAVYDHEGHSTIRGEHASESNAPYVRPLDRQGNPMPDFGGGVTKMPWFSAGGDTGLFLGGQLTFTDYGFRKHPYGHRQTVRAGYATALSAFHADYEGDFAFTNSRKRWNVLAHASQLDLLRFYGFGNETGQSARDDFHHVDQSVLSFSPSFRFGLDPVDLWVGPVVKYASTDAPSNRFIGLSRPYGVGDFGEVGARARLVFDRRNRAAMATKGVLLDAAGTWYPKVWSVEDAFTEAHGQAALYLSLTDLGPTLALRAGGQKLWGDYPFHEAAYLGGPDTIRGLRPQRYAGDASVWGNAELRVLLAKVKVLVPAGFGVFGLYDRGRVWVDGETSDVWHDAYGGGAFLAFLGPQNALSLTVAKSEGATRVYVRGGFAF